MELLQTPDQAQLDPTAPAAQDAATAPDQTPAYQTMSSQELVDHLAVLLQQEELPERKLVESIRGQFIRRRERLDPTDKAENEAFEVQELRLEGLLSTFREHDKKRQEALEQLYAENKVKKEALLQRFEELFKSNEEGAEFGSLYATFTSIRDEWNALGQLDPKDAAVLNKRFYELRDQFYDLKAINDDLRQLDFKKNLDAKQAILEELRHLDEVKDTIAAYRRLQELTAQWHELGPVSKELRAEINAEFKQLSTAQHKRHQEFHDLRKASEEENLQAKERLCLQVEELLSSAPLSSHSAFNKAVEQIKSLQEEWRKIGRAPRKDNESIYQRFRAGIDAFFRRRNEFFKANHEHNEEVLKKKRELIERAAALKDSTAWEETTEALKELQKEWQELGSVSQKYSQKIWEEFRASFDYFFDRKKKEAPRKDKVYSEARKSLAVKREIIRELTAINEGEEPENLRELLNSYNERWKQAGAVPYKEREAINAAYRELLDALHGKLRRHREERRLSGYSASLDNLEGKGGTLQTEHARMQRHLDRLRSELQTYESNLTRLNVSSKSGSSLLSEIERKRDALVADIHLVEQKLALLLEKERQSEATE
ncbi:DUF349 domain-containing protein [uncultured Porphyromonas sp.]|uniref:DUF349 domain-containing protein n=1 Tax=uncultured Porphyromonas sp. TaxID=159274 RepID=UPI00262527FB|nr:DUF349 domain-containing protein [uncultured Porphyromonas sp.]